MRSWQPLNMALLNVKQRHFKTASTHKAICSCDVSLQRVATNCRLVCTDLNSALGKKRSWHRQIHNFGDLRIISTHLDAFPANVTSHYNRVGTILRREKSNQEANKLGLSTSRIRRIVSHTSTTSGSKSSSGKIFHRNSSRARTPTSNSA